MKIVKVKDLKNTSRHVKGVGFDSMRILLESDGMGFSLHKTIIPKGEPQHWHYKYHLESCYCVSGLGVITNLETGESFKIEPDTTYVLDHHDDHMFEALKDTVLISVFNPPVTGEEIHQEDGSYSCPEPKTSLAQLIVEKVSYCNDNYTAVEEVTNLLKLNYVL